MKQSLKMKPIAVGAWDGVHLWVDWQEPDPDSTDVRAYEIRIRQREGEYDREFTWARPPLIVPLYRNGRFVVEVRAKGTENWERAEAFEFGKPRCDFQVTCLQDGVLTAGKLMAGVQWWDTVAGGGYRAAAYLVGDTLTMKAGETRVVTWEARDTDPWAQVRAAGVFDLHTPHWQVTSIWSSARHYQLPEGVDAPRRIVTMEARRPPALIASLFQPAS